MRVKLESIHWNPNDTFDPNHPKYTIVLHWFCDYHRFYCIAQWGTCKALELRGILDFQAELAELVKTYRKTLKKQSNNAKKSAMKLQSK